jgi:hypothetical protein
MADTWAAYSGESAWTKAAREFGDLGGLAQYWSGIPGSKSAIGLTFALFAPDGTKLPCEYRLKDIRSAIALLKGVA